MALKINKFTLFITPRYYYDYYPFIDSTTRTARKNDITFLCHTYLALKSIQYNIFKVI